jgi:hypothetical protein
MYANILLEQLTVESDVSLTVRVLRVRGVPPKAKHREVEGSGNFSVKVKYQSVRACERKKV